MFSVFLFFCFCIPSSLSNSELLRNVERGLTVSDTRPRQYSYCHLLPPQPLLSFIPSQIFNSSGPLPLQKKGQTCRWFYRAETFPAVTQSRCYMVNGNTVHRDNSMKTLLNDVISLESVFTRAEPMHGCIHIKYKNNTQFIIQATFYLGRDRCL